MNSRVASAEWQLYDEEPPPFRTYGRTDGAPVVLLCDHASARIPRALDNLGLPDHLLALHIAYDIGIEALTRRLADQLHAHAVMSSYSRLVIDMNRGLRFPESIPAVSDGHTIPGNVGLSSADREARAQTLFWPYHGAVSTAIAHYQASGRRPVVLSMHSFTPHMGGVTRPWQIGVLWKRDQRLARPLIECLRADGLTVGDNEPYTGDDPRGFTMEHHALAHGLPHVLVEVRQDLLTDESGIEEWATVLARAFTALLARPLPALDAAAGGLSERES